MLECSNYCSLLNVSIQKSTELQKELKERVLADFKGFLEKCDQDEDKLFSMQIELLDDLKTSSTEEEFNFIQEYVKKQAEVNKTQYLQQVKELKIPEEMMKIFLESEKMKDLVHTDLEKMHNEVTTLFNDICIISSNQIPVKIPVQVPVKSKPQQQPQQVMDNTFFKVPDVAEENENENEISFSNTAQFVVDTPAVEKDMNKLFNDTSQAYIASSGNNDLFIAENESQEKQKLTTTIKPVDEFIMPGDSSGVQKFSIDFENGESGTNADNPESDGFLFDFGNSKDDDQNDQKEFSFHF